MRKFCFLINSVFFILLFVACDHVLGEYAESILVRNIPLEYEGCFAYVYVNGSLYYPDWYGVSTVEKIKNSQVLLPLYSVNYGGPYTKFMGGGDSKIKLEIFASQDTGPWDAYNVLITKIYNQKLNGANIPLNF